MSEDAQLELGFDTAGVKTGGQEVVRSLNDIKRAAEQSTGSMDKMASQSEASYKRQRLAAQQAFYAQVEAEKTAMEARVKQIQAQDAQVTSTRVKAAQVTARAVAAEYTQELDVGFKRDMARLKADQIQQFITPADARVQARGIALAYNNELAVRMRGVGLSEQLGAAGMQGTVSGSEVVGVMGQSVKSIEEVGKKSIFAGAGIGRLRYSFASLATQMLGVTPILGRVGSVMGSMAFGSVWVIGILAAIAAIAWAYKQLAADSILDAQRVKDAWAAAGSTADKVRGKGSAAEVLAGMKEGTVTSGLDAQKWKDRANTISNFGQADPRWQPAVGTLGWMQGLAMQGLTAPFAGMARLHAGSIAADSVTNASTRALATPVEEAKARAVTVERLTNRMQAEQQTPAEVQQAKNLMGLSLAGFNDKGQSNEARDENLKNYTQLKNALESLENKGRKVADVTHSMETAFQRLQHEAQGLTDSVQGPDKQLSHFDDVLYQITRGMAQADYAYEHLASKMKTKSVTAEHNKVHSTYAGMLASVSGARGTLASSEETRIRDQMSALEAQADKNPAEIALAQYNKTLAESKKLTDEARTVSTAFGDQMQSQRDEVNEAAKALLDYNLAIEASHDLMDKFKRPGANHHDVSALMADRASLERARDNAVPGSADQKKYQQGADEVNKLIHAADTWENHQREIIESSAKHFESTITDAFTRIEMGGQKSFTSLFHTIRDLFLTTTAQLSSKHLIDKIMGSDWFKKNIGGKDDHGDWQFASGKMGQAARYGNAALGATVGAYQVGQNAGSVAMGGAMGAAQGAAMGAEVGGPVGAVIGGVVGGVAGMMGAAAAAKKAAKDMKEARESFARAMADYVATANKTNSDLQKALSSNDATRQALIANANQTYSGKKYETQRNALIDQINKAAADEAKNLKEKFLQDLKGQFDALNGNSLTAQIDAINLAYQQNKNAIAAAGGSMDDYNKALQIQKISIDNATRAYNLNIQTTGQELQARGMEAQGMSYAAAQLRQKIAQEKELADFTEKYANSNPQLIEQLKQVQALEKANGAISLESAVRGGPSGFKVAQYGYEFANVAAQIGDAVKDAVQHIIDNPPTNINLGGTTIDVNGVQTPEDLLRKVVLALEIVKNGSLGINGKLSDALNLAASK